MSWAPIIAPNPRIPQTNDDPTLPGGPGGTSSDLPDVEIPAPIDIETRVPEMITRFSGTDDFLPIQTTHQVWDRNYFNEGDDQMIKNWAVADAAQQSGSPTINLANAVRPGMSVGSPQYQYLHDANNAARTAAMTGGLAQQEVTNQAEAQQYRNQIEAAKADEFNKLAAWMRDRMQINTDVGLGLKDIEVQAYLDQLENRLNLLGIQGNFMGTLLQQLMGNVGDISVPGLGGLGGWVE